VALVLLYAAHAHNTANSGIRSAVKSIMILGNHRLYDGGCTYKKYQIAYTATVIELNKITNASTLLFLRGRKYPAYRYINLHKFLSDFVQILARPRAFDDTDDRNRALAGEC